MLRRRRRSWWRGRATTSARRRKKDRRDHVRGARRSRTRGPSSRVDRSSAALGHDLFFPTRVFLFFLPAGRADGVDRDVTHRAGLVGFVLTKIKQSLSGQCSRCWVYASITIRTLSLHRTDACETNRETALCTISSRNRCTHAAQEVRTRRGTSDATQQWMRQENRCPSSPSAD